MAAKKKYKVTNVSGSNERIIEATSYSYSEETGRHTFKDGDDIIASLVNVNVEPA